VVIAAVHVDDDAGTFVAIALSLFFALLIFGGLVCWARRIRTVQHERVKQRIERAQMMRKAFGADDDDACLQSPRVTEVPLFMEHNALSLPLESEEQKLPGRTRTPTLLATGRSTRLANLGFAKYVVEGAAPRQSRISDEDAQPARMESHQSRISEDEAPEQRSVAPRAVSLDAARNAALAEDLASQQDMMPQADQLPSRVWPPEAAPRVSTSTVARISASSLAVMQRPTVPAAGAGSWPPPARLSSATLAPFQGDGIAAARRSITAVVGGAAATSPADGRTAGRTAAEVVPEVGAVIAPQSARPLSASKSFKARQAGDARSSGVPAIRPDGGALRSAQTSGRLASLQRIVNEADVAGGDGSARTTLQAPQPVSPPHLARGASLLSGVAAAPAPVGTSRRTSVGSPDRGRAAPSASVTKLASPPLVAEGSRARAAGSPRARAAATTVASAAPPAPPPMAEASRASAAGSPLARARPAPVAVGQGVAPPLAAAEASRLSPSAASSPGRVRPSSLFVRGSGASLSPRTAAATSPSRVAGATPTWPPSPSTQRARRSSGGTTARGASSPRAAGAGAAATRTPTQAMDPTSPPVPRAASKSTTPTTRPKPPPKE
jgi:hypothetical protein